MTGERGPQGDPGRPGYHGQPGDTGPVGKTGAKGDAIPRSWLIWIAGFLVVISVFYAAGFWFLRDYGQDTRQNIQHIQELREQRVKEQARTDLALCESINAERDILSDLLNSVVTNATDGQARRAEFFADALQRLEPSDCSKLPSQRPFQP